MKRSVCFYAIAMDFEIRVVRVKQISRKYLGFVFRQFMNAKKRKNPIELQPNNVQCRILER